MKTGNHSHCLMRHTLVAGHSLACWRGVESSNISYFVDPFIGGGDIE